MQPSLSLWSQFWEAISPTVVAAVQVVLPALATTAALILTRKGLRWGSKAPLDPNPGDTDLTIDLVRRALKNVPPTLPAAVSPLAPGAVAHDSEPPTKRSG